MLVVSLTRRSPVSYRLSLTRGLHVANRKELIPLIKLIHPDLSAHLPDAVRAQNMNCIQNLNDLWDTLESNTNYATGRNQAFGIDVKFPFRSQYDLTCFITPVATDEGKKGKPLKVAYTLNVPESMCRKQSISQKQFSQCIETVLTQQGKMFGLAGLKNPWETTTQEHSTRERDQSSQTARDRKAGLSDELETYAFEKLMIKNHKHNRIGASSNRQGRSDYNRMYHPKYNNRSASLDNLFGNKLAHEAFFEDEADSYLKHGNVVVSDLSAKDEFLAVKKLRKLLVNFGDVLNFSFDKWRAVYIMLYQYGGKERYVSGRSTSSSMSDRDMKEGSSAKNSINDADLKEGDEDEAENEPPAKVSNGGYVLETHGQLFILRVPHDFRSKHLLDFAGAEVPAAQLILH